MDSPNISSNNKCMANNPVWEAWIWVWEIMDLTNKICMDSSNNTTSKHSLCNKIVLRNLKNSLNLLLQVFIYYIIPTPLYTYIT